jgi:hypothetical protein
LGAFLQVDSDCVNGRGLYKCVECVDRDETETSREIREGRKELPAREERRYETKRDNTYLSGS